MGMLAWALPAYAQVNTAPSYYSADDSSDAYGGAGLTWNGAESYGIGHTGAAGDRAFSIGPGHTPAAADPTAGNFGSGDFTLHLFTRLARGGGISQEVLSKRAVCGGGSFLDLRAGLRFGGGSYLELQDLRHFGFHVHNPVNILDGKWHEITVIRDGELVSLTVDAITTSRYTHGVVDLDTPAPMRFGDGPCSAAPGRPGDTTTPAVGELDDISFGPGTSVIGPPPVPAPQQVAPAAPPAQSPPSPTATPGPQATPTSEQAPETPTPETSAPETAAPETPTAEQAPPGTPAPAVAAPPGPPAPPGPAAGPPPARPRPHGTPAPAPAGGPVDRGPAAAAFSSSLPAPSQVNTQLRVVAQDASLAILLLALLSLPIGLINDTLEANTDRLAAAAARARRLRLRIVTSWTDRIPLALGLALFALVAALEYGFIEPSFGLDLSSMALVVGLAAGLLTISLTKLTKRIYLSRVHSIPSFLNVFPAFALVGLACVATSRLVGLQPGLILGTLAGLGAAAELRKEQEGRAAAIATATLLVVGVIAWVARTPLVAAAGPDGAFLPSMLDVALTTIVVAAAETLAFGLLPLSFLEGAALFEWSKAVWASFAVLGAFAFVHVLLHPASGAGEFAGRIGYLLVLLGIYFAVALSFWAWFRFTMTEHSNEGNDKDGHDNTEQAARA